MLRRFGLRLCRAQAGRGATGAVGRDDPADPFIDVRIPGEPSKRLESRYAKAEAIRALSDRLRDETPTKPLVLDLYGTTAADAHELGGLKAWSLFNTSSAVRKSSHYRDLTETCVVGGTAAIRNIWENHKVRPRVVYAPEHEKLPDWCCRADSPTIVVRCPAHKIRHGLLSAELVGDHYAAEFPARPLYGLHELASVPSSPADRVQRAIVLHNINVPSNVGLMIRLAEATGFDAVVLAGHGTHPYSEKVIRASGGAVFNPKLKIYTDAADASAVSVQLQQAAISHRMLPIVTAPSQDCEHIFTVAQRFYAARAHTTAAAKEASEGKEHRDTPLGVMLLMGASAEATQGLVGDWQIPTAAASLRMDNPMVESLNVSVAASVMMHYFRPGAEAEFAQWREMGLRTPEEDDGKPDDVRLVASSPTAESSSAVGEADDGAAGESAPRAAAKGGKKRGSAAKAPKASAKRSAEQKSNAKRSASRKSKAATPRSTRK